MAQARANSLQEQSRVSTIEIATLKQQKKAKVTQIRIIPQPYQPQGGRYKIRNVDVEREVVICSHGVKFAFADFEGEDEVAAAAFRDMTASLTLQEPFMRDWVYVEVRQGEPSLVPSSEW